jgi:uncharacterized protein YdeI (YjbR/CyaY-like superfamily)
MGTRDPRIDAYLSKAQPFAQEILTHLRDLVHDTIPEVQETIKWGMPHFEYKGILCHMAAFKQHCAFGFWHHAEVTGQTERDAGMGSLGKITSVGDLPATRVLTGYLQKAKALNEAGVKKAPARKAAAPIEVPPALAQALDRHPAARQQFDAMSPGHRREYCAWIAGAKQEATRERRIEKALEQIAEGKSQNWKYEAKR